MHDLSDAQLLRAYAERGAETAFAEIVARHTDLVYSAALRQVYSPDLARDVTQSVFTDLARKAREVSFKLTPEASLVGWLYRGTRFAARDLNRTEIRRTQRERQAMEQLHPASETPPDWEQLRPALDDAMSELDETDRDAVLLRYFKNHDLRTVGATLGISDDAAQKRVSRAVERLRELFAKRGVTVGAGGLAAVISANAVQAAPVGLALTITTAAALSGTTLATTATATKAIAMTALQKTIVTATIAVLAGAGIYEARQASQLRDQVQTLQQQQAQSAEQIQNLLQERDDAKNRLGLMADEIVKAKGNNSELLKLRGDVGMLRRQLAEISPAAPPPSFLASEVNTLNESATNLSAKVERLKSVLERMPYLKIPELEFASEKDWLLAASCGGDLKTDENYRWAYSQLRGIVEDHFGSATMRALEKYKQSNNGQFPTELSQLQPYYKTPMNPAILQRYEIVPANSVPDSHMDDDWVITTKAPVDRSDRREVIDSKGYGHGSRFYSPDAEKIKTSSQ